MKVFKTNKKEDSLELAQGSIAIDNKILIEKEIIREIMNMMLGQGNQLGGKDWQT